MKKVFLLPKVLSFITILSLIITFCGFGPKTAKAATNPPMPESCGLDMILVIDTSTSITGSGMTGDLGKMKTAFDAFVDAVLPATPAKIGVVSFDDTAVVNLALNTNPTTIKNAINTIDGDGYTNWESALSLAQIQFPSDGKPHLIVFTSDGNPTASNSGGAVNLNQPNKHLTPAINMANAAWTAGTRIITLGIGTAVNSNNLIAISSDDASFTATSFSGISASMQDIATKLCGGKIITTKIIDADGDLTTTNDQTPGAGWNFTVAGVPMITDAQGKTLPVSISDKNGPFAVLQISQPGYVPIYVSCVNVTNNNQPVGIADVLDIVNGINMTTDDIISCTFYSKPGLPPTGTLSATNCIIPIGFDTCNTSLTWTTQNPIHTSMITTPTNITVASANSGTNVSYPITYGSRNFFLYNNGDPYLAMATASAGCGDPTKAYLDGITKKCVGVLSGKLETDLSAGLNGPTCYIKAGERTCKTAITINIENPIPNAATEITKAVNVVVASGLTPPKKESIVVDHPSTKFYLYHGGHELDTMTVYAECESPAFWDGTKGMCVLSPVNGYWKEACGNCNQTTCRQSCTRECIWPEPHWGGNDCPSTSFNSNRRCYVGACGGNGLLNIKLDAAPAKILKGKNTTLTWTSNGDSCLGTTNNTEIFETGGKANGSMTVKPLTTTTYKLTCTDNADGTTEFKVFIVKVDTMNEIER
jgi:hypothetical protein